MSPTPASGVPSSGSGSGSGGAASPDNYRVIRKRNRVPLSCAPCRHRKLKCNRQSPCDNCTKRGDASSCAYAAPVPRKKGSQNSGDANATPDDMQNRIDRLESLVLSLMTNGSSSAGPTAANQAISSANTTTTTSTSIGSGSLGPNLDIEPDDGQDIEVDDNDNDHDNDEDDHDDHDDGDDDSDTERVTKSFGILKVDPERQKTVYIGEAHWAALLNEIGEVKSYFARNKKNYEAHLEKVAKTRLAVGSEIGAGPSLLLSASEPPSRAAILAQVPSRYLSDVLISRYFSTFDPAIHIIHPKAFHREYNAHWQDPSKTSIVWVAKLFAMMRLAMISYFREEDEPLEFKGRSKEMAANFRNQMTHCLITADYTKPHNHIVETLIFHLHAEYTSNRDSEASIWILVGIIARLAMRMGYHRDPKLFSDLTPFQGEMRRRIWTFVRTADLLFSFQTALPPMIRIGDSDTDVPNNLFDEDFDEDSTVLPPSRPPNEATQSSYMIAKGRLAFGFGRVLEAVNGVDRKSYDEVLKIDRGLRKIYDGIPDYLKLKASNDITLSPVSLVMARFSLAILYHKSQCVLHGRFMRQARGNNRYAYSRRTSLESAMQLLQLQSLQHRATMERDHMKSIKSHFNSLATHDFSLAATVICMDLYNHHERPDNDVSTPNTSASGGSGGSSSGSSNSSGINSMQSDTGVYVPGLSYSRSDLLRALERSRDVYQSSQELSVEAYKATELLNLLLQHLRSPPRHHQPQQQSTRDRVVDGSLSPNAMNTSTSSADEQSAAMMLGILQSRGGGGVGGGQSLSVQDQATSFPPVQLNGVWDADKLGDLLGSPTDESLEFSNMFSNIGAAPSQFPSSIFNGIGEGGANMNLDWEMWDQYMQGSNIPLDPAVNLWGDDGPSPNSTSNSNSNGNGNGNGNSNSNSNDNDNDTLFTQTPTSSQPPAIYFDGQQNSQNGRNSKQDSQVPMSMSMSMPGLSADAPCISPTEPDSTAAGSAAAAAGQVFMGVQSPQPGGIPGWKQ